MPSFNLTGLSTVARTLLNGEEGFIGVNGSLVTTGASIDAAGLSKINVLGALTSFDSVAVDHDGTELRMDIGVNAHVSSMSSDTIASNFSGSARIVNFGTITSASDALDLRVNDDFGDIEVNNHGSIFSDSDGMVLLSGTGSTRVTNTGLIDGNDYGIFNAFESQGGVTNIINSGTIIGRDTASYGGDDSTETIINTGLMIGDVLLDDGDDTYNGRGGQVEGTVEGGSGGDTLIGGDMSDDFDGGTGTDTMRGRGGDDSMNGGGQNDEMRGGSGNDDMIGGGGADDMRGGKDDDTLNGGGSGDTLNGGKGDDVLSGGGGADTFVFGRVAGDDVITDFTNGTDQIDLTAFGLRPADFVGVVAPALSNAGGGATFLDLSALGGEGSILIEGLSFGAADSSDFIL